MNVYLDNAATTPLSPSVKSYIVSLLDQYQNPSSIYQDGQKSRRIIDESRKAVAKFINAPDESDILFTPGGAASNTLAIAGYYREHCCTLLYSPIMHSSALRCISDYKNSYPLEVDNQGIIGFNDLKDWVDIRRSNLFVVLEYANSELGTIQDVKKIIDLVHFYNGIVYLDCTGSIPTIPLDVEKLDIDMVGFSGHKLGALKGIGVLYKKKSIQLAPLIYGEQENHLVGGTENILGIASIGKVCESCDYSSVSPSSRNYVYNYIQDNLPDAELIGASISSGKRLPHNLYVCFKWIHGESLMMLFDMNGIQVSTGSACSSGSGEPSPVLRAIGMSADDISSCIRMTFSGSETEGELVYTCEKLKECVTRLREVNTR